MPMKGLSAICMAVVFLSLGACEESDPTPVASPALLDTGADIVIIGMEHIVTVDGVREGQVVADTAFIYNDSSEYVLRNPTLELFDEVEHNTYAMGKAMEDRLRVFFSVL